MEQWFRGYGIGGFLFHPSHLPSVLDDFVELVVPELQSRGLCCFARNTKARRCAKRLARPKSRYAD